MKCPHCEKVDSNIHHQLAERNAGSYGSGTFVFRCSNCGKKYSAYYEAKKVHISCISKQSDISQMSF